MNFVHLNVKSEFNQNSLIKVEALLNHCQMHDMKAVAINDTSLFHVVDFIQQAKSKGINPILASHFLLAKKEKEVTSLSISIYAKNREGFRHLTKLSSLAKTRKGSKQLIYFDEFEKNKENLIVVVDCYGLLASKKMDAFKMYMEFLSQHVGQEDFYIGIDRTIKEEKTEAFLVEYAKKYGKKIVAMQPVYYLNENDQKNHDILLAIHKGTKVTESSKAYSFLSQEEMMKGYLDIEEAISSTVEIAEKCQVVFPLKGEEGFEKKNPLFEAPEDFVVQPQFWKLFTPMKGYVRTEDEREIRSIAYLCTLAWRGFAKFYKKNDAIAMERLKEELGVIIGKGYSDYFLIVYDFMQFAIKNQISLGPGRGSAASSLLARCLGITEICPIQMNLQFERFLNVFREDDPDVDIDVSQEKRYELIRYAIEKYGKNRVAQIVTFKYYGLNDAIRACGKALEIKTKTINKVISAFSKTKMVDKTAVAIGKLVSTYAEFLQEVVSADREEFSDKTIRWMIESALLIQYIPQTDSKHAAGIILSQHDITEEIPVMFGKGKDSEDIYITQIPNNNQQLEKMGYTKIDLLGNRNVDILDKTKRLIQKNYGVSIDNIPFDDESVYKIFQEGALTGVFQMDSEGMQKASKTIQPIDMNDITVLLALYRPGPMDQIPVYKKNKEIGNVEIFDENGRMMENVGELKEVLRDTYGIIVFQEQVNKIAHVWAGYSLAEADILRRAISKKKREVLEQEGKIFLQKSIQNGRDKETTKKIYQLIVKFADYGFNRAHSAAYSLLSYQTAWYKVNFPKEYMSVLMTSVMKKIDKVSSYYNETKRLGLKIEKPDINYSHIGFVPKKKSISFGLAMVKNVGVVSVKEILAKRKEKAYESLQDFLTRVDSYLVNKETVECLIKVGAFDTFGDRKELLDELNGVKKPLKKQTHYSFSEIPGVEDDFKGEVKVTKQEIQKMSIEEQLGHEHQLTGAYVNEHFLSYYRELIADLIKNRPLKEQAMWSCGAVVSKKVIKDKNKNDMAFLTITNGKEEMEMVCFYKTWEKMKDFVQPHHILLFQVKKDPRGALLIEDFEKITNRKKFYAAFEKTDEGKQRMKELLALLKNHQGKDDLVVTFGSTKKISYASVEVSEATIDSVKGFEKEKRISILKKTQ